MTTTKTSDLSARIKASTAGSQASPSADLVGKSVAPQQASPSSTTSFNAVRFQVNMSKAQHRFIRQFAFEADADISTIIRLLLAKIETDLVFAEEVRTQPATFACSYLGKGRLVYIEGRLQSRQWQATDGSTRRTVEIVANRLQALSSKSASEESTAA